jgi:hypothetical protein
MLYNVLFQYFFNLMIIIIIEDNLNKINIIGLTHFEGENQGH